MNRITPSMLLVDLNATESKHHRMADLLAARTCPLRPCFKNYQAPTLALKLVFRATLARMAAPVMILGSVIYAGF